MVDTARQLLDELMGRNRNLDPNTAKIKKIQWDDQEVSAIFLLTRPLETMQTIPKRVKNLN